MLHADHYSSLWNQIAEIAPRAVLLRGPLPSALERQAEGHSDIDIHAGRDFEQIAALLRQQGFNHIYKPYPYLQRFRLRCPLCPKPYTIDLYKDRRWGAGFRACPEHSLAEDSRLGSLLHAVVDGKGTPYFEKLQNGPPWQQGEDFDSMFQSYFAKWLWRHNIKWMLTAYLCAKGVIRPEFRLVTLTFLRRTVFRLWQLSHKSGMEVALIGVDGTGKSSIAHALMQLPVPTRVIYMGPHSYRTRLMNAAITWKLPPPIPQLFFRYENLVRRLSGWTHCRMGYLVVYDRHPAEHLQPQAQSVEGKIRNAIDRAYAWRVDLTFWLTGDYSALYERKKDYPASYLGVIDHRFATILREYRLPFVKVDVTQLNLLSVTELISKCVLSNYAQRSSTARFTGPWRALLA